MTKGFRCGLALLGVLALAVWLAATVWFHRGWRAMDCQLIDQSGDPAALRGFTLNGRINWDGLNDSLHFFLHDGYLDTELVFDDQRAPFVARASYRTSYNYAVAPSARAAVEENATVRQRNDDGTPFVIESSTDTLLRTVTVSLSLPDGTDRMLRMAADTVKLDAPGTVMAMLVTGGDSPIYDMVDYEWDTYSEDAFADWPESAVAPLPFALNGGIGLCWEEDFLGMAPGLYRMNGLTTDELDTLPREGTVNGQPVICASTAFGSLEPFYCPADARKALLGASMADGYTLLVYLDGEDTLWADLVDEAGTRTDHRELGSMTGMSSLGAALNNRTNDRDAVLTLYDHRDDTDTNATLYMAALRTEEGRFTLCALLPESRFGGGDEAGMVNAAVLNAEGNALLIGRRHNALLPATNTGSQPEDGVTLEVYPLDGAGPSYRGLLATGADRDWFDSYDFNNFTLHRSARYLTFDPLPKDGGIGL